MTPIRLQLITNKGKRMTSIRAVPEITLTGLADSTVVLSVEVYSEANSVYPDDIVFVLNLAVAGMWRRYYYYILYTGGCPLGNNLECFFLVGRTRWVCKKQRS